jgi:glycosyltransferase involved in cell wall biosynthesis
LLRGVSDLHRITDVNWPVTCAVVIPCHNEERTVAGVVREARRHLPLVLVVDDCSDDETAAMASGAGAQTIRRSGFPGKGAAIKAGLDALLARRYTWAITLDGDGQHCPGDVPSFLCCAEETGAALVVGNRMHSAQALPLVRRVVNRWMSRRISRMAGKALPDSQCGFRLIDLRAWAGLRLETDHFEIESEMSLAFVEAGYGVEFVPIQVIGRGPQSHVHPVKDTWRWLQWWKHAQSNRQAHTLLSQRLANPSSCQGSLARNPF